jgi:hypothetical protein
VVVTAKIPTDVDNAGNIVYTNKKMALQNQTTTYVRAMYTNLINQTDSVSIKWYGVGQWTIQNHART